MYLKTSFNLNHVFLKLINCNFYTGTIITPDKYLGPIISLCIERRGVQKSATNIDNERVILQFTLPLSEIVIDFHDSLKTISSGYASFDYEDGGYQLSSLVKVSVLNFEYKIWLLVLFYSCVCC